MYQSSSLIYIVLFLLLYIFSAHAQLCDNLDSEYPSTCNGHGHCISQNYCFCDDRWFGPSCDFHQLPDPSFEIRDFWEAYDSFYVTPICTNETCYGVSAYDGEYFVRFGGKYQSTEGWVEGNIFIPLATPVFTFYLRCTFTSPSIDDWLALVIDRNPVRFWFYDECLEMDGDGSYQKQTINLSPYLSNDMDTHRVGLFYDSYNTAGIGIATFEIDYFGLEKEPSADSCGDGICNGNETCETCPLDCHCLQQNYYQAVSGLWLYKYIEINNFLLPSSNVERTAVFREYSELVENNRVNLAQFDLDFDFFGNDITEIFIAQDGAVFLSQVNTNTTRYFSPAIDAPLPKYPPSVPILVPLGIDLQWVNTSSIVYSVFTQCPYAKNQLEIDHKCLIIEWKGFKAADSWGDKLIPDFEIILLQEEGDIVFQYGSLLPSEEHLYSYGHNGGDIFISHDLSLGVTVFSAYTLNFTRSLKNFLEDGKAVLFMHKDNSYTCGDTVCDHPFETYDTCPGDCPLDTCGDGSCQVNLGENCISCPVDCPDCCYDGICLDTFYESCFKCDSTGLFSDCKGPCDVCGDGVCQVYRNENCESCNIDCGDCPDTSESSTNGPSYVPVYVILSVSGALMGCAIAWFLKLKLSGTLFLTDKDVDFDDISIIQGNEHTLEADQSLSPPPPELPPSKPAQIIKTQSSFSFLNLIGRKASIKGDGVEMDILKKENEKKKKKYSKEAKVLKKENKYFYEDEKGKERNFFVTLDNSTEEDY